MGLEELEPDSGSALPDPVAFSWSPTTHRKGTLPPSVARPGRGDEDARGAPSTGRDRGPGFGVAIHTAESLLELVTRGGRAMASGIQDPKSSCRRPRGLLGKADEWIPRAQGEAPGQPLGSEKPEPTQSSLGPGRIRGQTTMPVSPVLARAASPASTWAAASSLAHSGLPSRVLSVPARGAHTLVCPHSHSRSWISVQKIQRRESQDRL